MSDALTKARADYKQMLDQANDQGISADERDKRKQSAADKAKDVNSRQVAIETVLPPGRRPIERQKPAHDQQSGRRDPEGRRRQGQGRRLHPGRQLRQQRGLRLRRTETDISAAVLAQLNAGAPIDVVRPSAC